MKFFKQLYRNIKEKITKSPFEKNHIFKQSHFYNTNPTKIYFNPTTCTPSFKYLQNPFQKYHERFKENKICNLKGIDQYLNFEHMRNKLDLLTQYAQETYESLAPKMNNLEAITVSECNNGYGIRTIFHRK